ncbi:MAG: SRPBCC family protein [Acidimicrobiales bacterium]
MADIRHRVGIEAPQESVYRAVATSDGLRTWWTRRVEGDPSVGGSLDFFFGNPEPSAVMKVVELSPPHCVVWRCVGGPDEWVGTHVTFDVKRNQDESALVFTHGDWREPVEFMHHCSTKWAYFLLGLKASLEGARGTPFPEDVRISSWG